jgi:hypothetical protein
MQNPSFYDSFQKGVATTKSSLFSFSETMASYASQAKAAMNSYKEQYITSQRLKKSSYWETRDLYPRMGWHDVHAGISGRAARDVASHFIQVSIFLLATTVSYFLFLPPSVGLLFSFISLLALESPSIINRKPLSSNITRYYG